MVFGFRFFFFFLGPHRGIWRVPGKGSNQGYSCHRTPQPQPQQHGIWAANRGSQAKGPVAAVATGLWHSHSNIRSEPCLWPTLQPNIRQNWENLWQWINFTLQSLGKWGNFGGKKKKDLCIISYRILLTGYIVENKYIKIKQTPLLTFFFFLFCCKLSVCPEAIRNEITWQDMSTQHAICNEITW